MTVSGAGRSTHRRSGQRRRRGPAAADGGAANAFVLIHVGQLVASGLAELDELDGGIMRLRLQTGQTFLRGEATVTRLS